MRYLIPEEATKKAVFHHYLQSVLSKIPSVWPWLPLKLPPGPYRTAPRVGKRALFSHLSSAGLQEFGMPPPSKANLRFALSGQDLTTCLLKQCQCYRPICITAFSREVSRRNSRLSGFTSPESAAAPAAVHAEKRVLLWNPDHCAAGNTWDCCQKETIKFDFAAYQVRETRAPGSGKRVPMPVNASYRFSLGIMPFSDGGRKLTNYMRVVYPLFGKVQVLYKQECSVREIRILLYHTL